MTWQQTVISAPRRRLSRCTLSGSDVAQQPAQLLEQAREIDPSVTLAEYTAARLIASEIGRGSPEEMAAVVDVLLERSSDLTAYLTHDGRYGRQGSTRAASTARDPDTRHLAAARAVLGGDARGITHGASHFFSPRAQDALHRRDPDRTPRGALEQLEHWSADLAWIGPVAGIDPWHLLCLSPGADAHRTAAAAAIIRRRRAISAIASSPVTLLLLCVLGVLVA